MQKKEYRVYREAQITDEDTKLEPVLIDTFKNPIDAFKLVQRLVKEDSHEFAHEFYFSTLYEQKSTEENTWVLNTTFGKKYSNPKTAAGIFKNLE